MSILKRVAFLFTFFIYFTNSAQDKTITVSHKINSDNSVDFFYEKTKPGSYTVKIVFSRLRNTNSSNIQRVVKHSKGLLTKLRPSDPKKSIGYGYNISYHSGILNPKVKKDLTYLLPVEKNETIDIQETGSAREKFLGKPKPNSWKAYVIKKNKESAFSMRKGIVVRVNNENSLENDSEFEYTSKKNNIKIEHDDGTYATYKGFKKDGIIVKLGQEVSPQQKLGDLAKTEDSNYKLYFFVNYRYKDGEEDGVEFLAPKFLTSNGIEYLEKNKTYTSAFTENIFFSEFSKKEKKKYLKAKK